MNNKIPDNLVADIKNIWIGVFSASYPQANNYFSTMLEESLRISKIKLKK